MEEELDALQEIDDRLGEGEKSSDLCCKGGSDSGVEENCAQGNAEGASCDSSLLSYCNSSEELVTHNHQCDAVESEGGSESSSLAGHSHQGNSVLFRTRESRPSRPSQLSGSRRALHKERSLSRTPSSSSRAPPSNRTSSGGLTRSLSVRTPETLKTTPRLNRVRSPAVTPDDGRWPSNMSRTAKTKERKTMTTSLGPSDGKLAFEKCATLPRRRRRSVDNLLSPPSEPTVNLKVRDQSLNRTASLRRKKLLESQLSSTPPKPTTPSSSSMSRGKSKTRTRIFHETAVQTSLTAKDLEAGPLPYDIHSRIVTATASVQADRRIERVEKLESELKDIQHKLRKVVLENENLEKLKDELIKEREKRQFDESRLQLLLPTPCEGDVVEAVEKEHNFIKGVCLNQQKEINQIQSLCCHLQKELDKSLKAQHKFLKHQEDAEAESLEMQEFLVAEKSALADTLKEIECEVKDLKTNLQSKEGELVKQQEECTHLVRMCEQRRQENLYLETRLRAVETCSKESMLVHGAAASGAAVALSSLGNRLEILVEALVTAYEISQADLEDVIFHNEVFTHSSESSSETNSGSSSPKPVKPGFVAAIINAIKAATIRSTSDTFSDGDLLSAEPEPSGFLRDITCTSSPGDKRHSITSLPSLSDMSPTKYSNRASYAASEQDLELGNEGQPSEGGITNSESLQNLSEAIIRRQKEEEESAKEMATINHSVQTGLIDQVIEVDNLITKLLKVMHIIQLNERKSERSSENEPLSSSKVVIDSLRKQILALEQELKTSSNSRLQVDNLQKAILLKEKELNSLEKKYALTEELLTSNWHKAMAEVRRQYKAVDKALELLDGIDDQVDETTVLSLVKRELENSNVRSSSTLPVSSSQPDLNANEANATNTPRPMNGRLS